MSDYTESDLEDMEDSFNVICKKLCDIFSSKNHDYGPTNISEFGDHGVVIRLSDKIARLRNLYKKGQQPKHESIDDTFLDIATYAIIALMCRNGSWYGFDPKEPNEE